MNRCDSCKINVNTNEKVCPLCGNEFLEGDDYERIYPKYENFIRTKKRVIAFKILIILSILALLICTVVNLKHWDGVFWAGTVTGGLAYVLIVTYQFMISKNLWSMKIFNHYVALIILFLSIKLVLVDVWPLGFVLGLAGLVTTTLHGAFLVFSVRKWREYIYPLKVLFLISLTAFILGSAGVIPFSWPVISSTYASFGLLLTIFMFTGKKFIIEMKKRFHI